MIRIWIELWVFVVLPTSFGTHTRCKFLINKVENNTWLLLRKLAITFYLRLTQMFFPTIKIMKRKLVARFHMSNCNASYLAGEKFAHKFTFLHTCVFRGIKKDTHIHRYINSCAKKETISNSQDYVVKI